MKMPGWILILTINRDQLGPDVLQQTNERDKNPTKAEENLWQDRGGREPDASKAATISWPAAK